MFSTKNTIANIINLIGVLETIIGVLGFFILLAMSEGEALLLALGVLIVSVVGGVMLLGFGEIISLLDAIAGNAGKHASPEDPLKSLPRL